MIYTLCSYCDYTKIDHIAQTTSLGVILDCVQIDVKSGYKMQDMRLYASKGNNNINHIINNGEILDIGYQLAMYQIFVSVIRVTAKQQAKNTNVKQDLIYLRKKYQQFYGSN